MEIGLIPKKDVDTAKEALEFGRDFARVCYSEKDWEEIGEKVESKVMRKLKDWAEDEESTESGKEWEEICGKVENKLKRKIREWAEKD